MVLGLLVRLLMNVHFYFFFLGTFFCSLGFCFMVSGANRFANLWFPKHQIFLINSICVFAIFASDALGTFCSTYLIRENSSKSHIYDFFMWQGIAMIAIQLLMTFFFRGVPKSLQKYCFC